MTAINKPIPRHQYIAPIGNGGPNADGQGQPDDAWKPNPVTVTPHGPGPARNGVAVPPHTLVDADGRPVVPREPTNTILP